MQSVLDLEPPPAHARIPYGPGPLHFGDLWLPQGPGPHPLVFALHGGFWRARYDLTYLGHLCAALAREGFATFSVEYRRVGQPGGGFPGTLADVGRAADFLPELARRHPLSLEHTVALGHSAGGQLALWVAGRHRLPGDSPLRPAAPFRFGAVVSLAGVTDLVEGFRQRLGDGIIEELMGGSPEAVPARYAEASPTALVPLGVPQVLVHGTLDDTVPYAFSEAYAACAQAAGDMVRLRSLPGMGHYEPVDPRSRAFRTVLEAVRVPG